ncbi:hypothetical protein M501DRAFT_1057108 [Patellaria atrata CBS 101060]|uniref:BTB domain-containing protein n=1 Tax=Patellaria atrata CBS 101060 TaxID=1346257 RepID=A0A9P4SBT6_9PEZI|nr:hypothetical protein M501DRAFT_1057108 [Patellaria atrata CBS 101060]
MSYVYKDIICSEQFTFFIGSSKTPIVAHSAAIARQSDALNSLINGRMLEAQSRSAHLEDIDEHDFVRFCQFAYMGDFTPPLPITVVEEPEPSPLEEDEPPLEEPLVEVVEELPVQPQGWVPVEEPVPVPVEADFDGFSLSTREGKTRKGFSYKNMTKKERLRRSFKKKNYYSEFPPATRSAYACHVMVNNEPYHSYTNVFLSLSRLYTFADKYGVEPLKSLCLLKLHETLANFKLHREQVSDIVELARYAYSNENTPDYENTVDELRALVREYIVCEIDTIGASTEFSLLLEEGGAFVRDFWQMVQLNFI